MWVDYVPEDVSAGVNKLWVIQVNNFGQLLNHVDGNMSHQFDFRAPILSRNLKDSLFAFLDFILWEFSVDTHGLTLFLFFSWWRGLLLLLLLFLHCWRSRFFLLFLFNFFFFGLFYLIWLLNLLLLLLLGLFWVLLIIILISVFFSWFCNLYKL